MRAFWPENLFVNQWGYSFIYKMMHNYNEFMHVVPKVESAMNLILKLLNECAEGTALSATWNTIKG